jgi:hypothetical protein
MMGKEMSTTYSSIARLLDCLLFLNIANINVTFSLCS